MKILFAATESAPFYKTGGLGDVVDSLSIELNKQGDDVRVILPYFKSFPKKYKDNVRDIMYFFVQMGSNSMYCGIKELVYKGVTYYFVDNESYFNRDNLYGYWDDGERFAFFSMAVCEVMEKIDFIPDIIHVHDWHVGMVPVLLTHKYHWINAYRNIRKVLTIHNLQFQGIYDPLMLDVVFGMGYDAYKDDGLKYNDRINYLKGAIHYSDRITTVSPSYAKEIQTYEFGEHLDGDLRYNSWKIRGILNGIDVETNNPKTDERIAYQLKESFPRYKTMNKVALQERLGLPTNDAMLVGMVTRLTDQKGIQLVIQKLHEIMQRHVQVVILGTGNPDYENELRHIASMYPDKLRAIIEFDIGLAQQIYAGSDVFLMPSAFEPCGLSQMFSFRYGTIPLVHETGGLRDSVIPYNPLSHEGTGFSFNTFTADSMLEVIDLSLNQYFDYPENWKALGEKALTLDFSWKQSIKQYQEMYQELLNES
ncbi:glycogen synthase GlgA [Erysipelothrix sp. HDW6A]|uniref:glycogen synthase GlgA n=1 Tax=Erysipelothrix sp. HDW6A TaxID=2714928 RepID=UPI00140D3069|nr:glycogen synthase GlgA [Erysipelothrix sp. HDW6A]QIK58038.1 glycogen synthase GlgA [Erysipelothrix sp. HDW6A]